MIVSFYSFTRMNDTNFKKVRDFLAMLNSTIEHYLADKWAECFQEILEADNKAWQVQGALSGRVHPLLLSTSLNEVASAGLSFDVANSPGQPHSIRVIVR